MTHAKPAISIPDIASVRATQVAERRREARYPTNDPAEIQILPWSTATVALPSTIIDVSKSGLRVKLATTLARGIRIEIMVKPRRLVIFGSVRYCRRLGPVFHAGVLIEGVAFPKPSVGQHVDDDQFVLYAAARGLTTPEVIHINEHTSKCAECFAKLLKTSDEMRSALRTAPQAYGVFCPGNNDNKCC